MVGPPCPTYLFFIFVIFTRGFQCFLSLKTMDFSHQKNTGVLYSLGKTYERMLGSSVDSESQSSPACIELKFPERMLGSSVESESQSSPACIELNPPSRVHAASDPGRSRVIVAFRSGLYRAGPPPRPSRCRIRSRPQSNQSRGRVGPVWSSSPLVKSMPQPNHSF